MNFKETYFGDLRTADGILFQERVDSLSSGSAKAAFQKLRQDLRTSEKSGERDKAAWAMLKMAMVVRGQRQYPESIQILEKARDNFSSTGNNLGLAATFEELSYSNRELNRNALALEYSHKAIKLYQGLNRPLELAWAYNNVANIFFNLSRRSESLNYAKKARAIFVEYDDQGCLAWNACNLGSLYYEMGFLKQSERYYLEALKVFQTLKNKQGVAWALLWLGFIMRSQCAFKEAEKYLESARREYQDLGLKDRVGWCFLHMASIKRTYGEIENAYALNKKAVQFFTPLKNHDGVAWGFFQIGQLLRDRGQLLKAWQTFREALNLHTDISSRKGMGWDESEWGMTYMSLNDQSHALESFIRAKVLADQLDSLSLKAEVNKNLANYYMDEGMLQKAVDLLQTAQQLCKKIHSWETHGEALLARARCALIVFDAAMARECLASVEKSIETYALYRLRPLQALYSAELAYIEGREEQAVRLFEKAISLSQQFQQGRTRVEALLGLVQLQRNKKSIGELTSKLVVIEKEIRSLSSRKLRAKFLFIKGLISYMNSDYLDDRAFSQAFQILDAANLFVVKRQMLGTLIDLYNRKGNVEESKELQEEMRQLLDKTSVDLRLVHLPPGMMNRLPVSVVS